MKQLFDTQRHPNHKRMAFTLLEIIVVLGVVALLLAITLPAVLGAREAQRRTVCASRLGELGKAITAHEATFGYFPSAEKGSSSDPRQSNLSYTAHVYLLPYLDQAALFSRFNFDLPMGDHLTSQDSTAASSPNALVKQTRLNIFLCPSDSAAEQPYPGNNYRLNVGPETGAMKSVFSPGGGGGAFTLLKCLRSADFQDGLSNTIAMSERTRGSGKGNGFANSRDYGYSGIEALLGRPPSADELIPVCDSIAFSGAPVDFYPNSGSYWVYGYFETTWYNHATTPNSATPDCSSGSAGGGSLISYSGILSARGLHKGGVNCLFMDGHTSFASDRVDLEVWRSLSTRAGADVVTPLGD